MHVFPDFTCFLTKICYNICVYRVYPYITEGHTLRNTYAETDCRQAVLLFEDTVVTAYCKKASSMKSTNELKDALLESAVHVVAQHGLEKTTTKLIASDAHVNEVYIYRCYENKDTLLKAAFHAEDIRLAVPVHKTMTVMWTVGLSWKERCFLLWKPCWEFILHKPDDCRFCLQYYYSASCRQYAYEEHLAFYRPLVEEIRPVFRPETNADMLLHRIFDTMLSFASRVLSGEVENSEKNRETDI